MSQKLQFVLYFFLLLLIIYLLIDSYYTNAFGRWIIHDFDLDPYNKKDIAQDDSEMINSIKKNHLVQPPDLVNSTRLVKNTSQFSQILQELFKNNFAGFFIECGANDGEFLSNTLYLERNQNWTGLLIEADPIIFPKLIGKKRNAWLANVCLSGSKPEKVEFLHHTGDIWYNKGMNRINKEHINESSDGFENIGIINCFPLYSILLALPMEIYEIDYFSLDIEGHELEVLRGFPFDKIKIKYLSVEYILIPEGKNALANFLKTKNYDNFNDNGYELFFKLKY